MDEVHGIHADQFLLSVSRVFRHVVVHEDEPAVLDDVDPRLGTPGELAVQFLRLSLDAPVTDDAVVAFDSAVLPPDHHVHGAVDDPSVHAFQPDGIVFQVSRLFDFLPEPLPVRGIGVEPPHVQGSQPLRRISEKFEGRLVNSRSVRPGW
jgi:hypothetical protein